MIIKNDFIVKNKRKYKLNQLYQSNIDGFCGLKIAVLDMKTNKLNLNLKKIVY